MDKIGQSPRNEYDAIEPSKSGGGSEQLDLKLQNEPAPILNARGPLPIFLNGPHSVSFKNLTVESHEATEKYFPQKEPRDQKPEAGGFWNKAKAALWGGISSCTHWVEGKLSSGEIQQASKIASTGRKFQAGMTHVWNTQNLFNLTRSPKTHLDYGLSALSAASGLYKFMAKHSKDEAKYAKMLNRIDSMTEALKEAYIKADGINQQIASKLDLIRKKAAENPYLDKAFSEKENQLAQLEADILNIQKQDNALDDDDRMQLNHLRDAYKDTQTAYEDLFYEVESKLNLTGIPLEQLRGDQKDIEKDIARNDADITQLLHEAHELSKKNYVTTALLQVAGGKSVVTGVKTATYYGSDYSAMLNEHSKAIKGYLDNYLMVPIFITGLSVSLYGSYTLGQAYSNRSGIEATAQKMLSENQEDPELEAFISLVASKQRTTQALLSFGSAMGKATQNALALGVAFGGISIASAATGISEEILHTVITPIGWAIGGAVACTSLGLKAYQNYQESNRKQQEAFWVQMLHESNSDAPIASLSEDYKALADEVVQEMDLKDKKGSPMERYQAARDMVDLIVKNEAILNLMKLNVDFAVGIIVARLRSSEGNIAESTKEMLEGLGIQPHDIEQLNTMSAHVASSALKEKLCLL